MTTYEQYFNSLADGEETMTEAEFNAVMAGNEVWVYQNEGDVKPHSPYISGLIWGITESTTSVTTSELLAVFPSTDGYTSHIKLGLPKDQFSGISLHRGSSDHHIVVHFWGDSTGDGGLIEFDVDDGDAVANDKIAELGVSLPLPVKDYNDILLLLARFKAYAIMQTELK
ncbi:hypothetical protein FG446_003738 [Yersinia enterocolitica]|nr:hypothetical protein [Yersinia enterocolitica]